MRLMDWLGFIAVAIVLIALTSNNQPPRYGV